MMRAQVERRYDEYEHMASMAMMTRQAYHAKKLKQTDLFKRPLDEDIAKDKAEEARNRSEYTMKWLSQFKEFRGKEGVIN